MKRVTLYIATAVILGVLVTVVPLITLAAIRDMNQNYAQRALPFFDGEGTEGSEIQRSYLSDLEILGISFVIALLAYLLVRRRMPNRPYIYARMPPS